MNIMNLIKGGALGIIGAFAALCLLTGGIPDDEDSIRWFLLLSSLPGALLGILVTYILERGKKKIQPSSVSEELVKLKTLLETHVITQEEFDALKNKLLNK